MNLALVDYVIEGDDLVAEVDGEEVGREPIASAIVHADELAVRLRAAGYVISERS